MDVETPGDIWLLRVVQYLYSFNNSILNNGPGNATDCICSRFTSLQTVIYWRVTGSTRNHIGEMTTGKDSFIDITGTTFIIYLVSFRREFKNRCSFNKPLLPTIGARSFGSLWRQHCIASIAAASIVRGYDIL